MSERIRLFPFYREGECFIYAGGCNSNGSPVTSDAGKSVLVSRVVYRAFTGQIPTGRMITRTCKNRKCIRPDHLQCPALRDE